MDNRKQVTRMNWQALFRDYILYRGYSYFLSGLVGDIEEDDAGISASVRGTEEYQVHIAFEGNAIGRMTCTCPYSDGQKNCKHMAAVLYKWYDDDKTAYGMKT